MEIQSFFINLDSRKDRKEKTLEEFAQLGLSPPTRFVGAVRNSGGLGCATSHRNLMRHLAKTADGLVLVCEDDVEFRATLDEIDTTVRDFQNRPALGVLCLAYRNRGPRLPISPQLALANNIQTAACYIVKPSAMTALQESFEASVTSLEAGGPWSRYANDQLWKRLQNGRTYFCIPRVPLAGQRAGFSDIAMKDTFYG